MKQLRNIRNRETKRCNNVTVQPNYTQSAVLPGIVLKQVAFDAFICLKRRELTFDQANKKNQWHTF